MKLTSKKFEGGLHLSSRFGNSIDDIGHSKVNLQSATSIGQYSFQTGNTFIEANNFDQPSLEIMDMKESSNINLKDRRDQSTRIMREMQKVSKNHNNIRKLMMKKIRANSKDFSEELNK